MGLAGIDSQGLTLTLTISFNDPNHSGVGRYRFPGVGGESYQDMILRLHEAMLLLEQTTVPVMLVVNKAVLRVILAYFQGVNVEEMPYLNVPGHFHGEGGCSSAPEQVIELERTHSGFSTSYVDLTDGYRGDSVPRLQRPKSSPKLQAVKSSVLVDSMEYW